MDERRKGSDTPYQLVFFHGVAEPAAAPPGSRLIPLIFNEPNAELAVSTLAANDLASADSKTTAIFVSQGDVASALVGYAAVIGFLGRFIDISAGHSIEQLSPTLAVGRRLARQADSRRDEVERFDRVVVAPAPINDEPTLIYDPADPLPAFDMNAASVLRFARRVTLVPPADMHTALRVLAAVAGMRSTTKVSDRLPDVFIGTGLVDLEQTRKSARVLRNKLSAPGPEQIAKKAKPSPAASFIFKARSMPMEPVLELLGSELSESGEFWRCPRPQNHANGDRNPSMKVTDGKIRCFVCDAEWMDPLQLVLSVMGLAPLEAARYIIAHTGEPAAAA